MAMDAADRVLQAARKLIEFVKSPSWHFSGDFGDFDECEEPELVDVRWPEEFRELRQSLIALDRNSDL